MVAVAGLDPMRFLESDDPVEITVMWVVTQHALKERLHLNEHLAQETINRLSKAME
jgi:hypothetical protein